MSKNLKEMKDQTAHLGVFQAERIVMPRPAGLFEWRVRVNHDVLRSLFLLCCGNGREQS